MEVHHHTHTARSKWKHYFYEFLMLFLAVFCGFLAEYQLEHVIEHQREKEYIYSLQEDLRSDTANLESSIQFWSTIKLRVGQLRGIIRPLQKDSLELIYQSAAAMMNFDEFKYNDRTIEQLRSAGNFRLIRKEIVGDSLLAYDNFVRNELRSAQGASKEVFMNLMRMQTELFDSKVMEEKFEQVHQMSANLAIAPTQPGIYGSDEKWLTYYNTLFLYKAGIYYIIKLESILKSKAANTLVLIKEEYDLN